MNLAPPAQNKWRRRLTVVTGALLVFTLVGFFVLPPIVKAQLEKRASAVLGRTVTVAKVRLNPFALSITLENLDVRQPDGRSSFLGWQRLYVRAGVLASLGGDWVLSAVELDGFHAAVGIEPDGKLSFADIMARLVPPTAQPAAAPAKPGRPLRIGRLAVDGARIDFTDRSRPQPFATTIGPVTFAATGLRTAGAQGAPAHFEATTEAGEKVAWTGTVSLDPVASTGTFSLENIVLAKYAPYYADRMQADVAAGKLSVHGNYEVGFAPGHPVMKLSDGAVVVIGLKVVERTGHAVAVELPSLAVNGINADAVAPSAKIASVTLTGGRVSVRRELDGTINLLALLPPPAAKQPAPPAAAATPSLPAPAKLPDVEIGEVALKDFAVDVTDLAAPRPAKLALSGIQFSLKHVTLADGAAMPLSLALQWAPQGTETVEGTVTIRPEIKADLKITVAGLAILPLSPYLEQFVNARITQGTVSTADTVHLSMSHGAPVIALVGDVTIDRFGLVDSAHDEDLAGFGSLALTGLQVSTAEPLTVKLTEVNLAAPYARLLINADKSLNLATVAKPRAGPAAATTATARPAGPPPRIEIGRVVIAGGDFSYADRSLQPNVRTALTGFGGAITGLSSEHLARATVDLRGAVDGAGPVAITGKLDPLGAKKFVDLKVDFKNVDLLPLSPYSGKFAGYELARGKLGLDVKVNVDGPKLDASNVITLNQFTFGAPVESPDATKLPVRLGVALLKDIDGQIVIDVPVQGSLDDPNLRIGRVVLRVIVNLLTKAAVSPFALLGSMFGGGGDELAWQEFAPGSSALLPSEQPKLATLVKALTNRPGLSLAAEGSYDGPADTYALKQQKLADEVRRTVWAAKHATDPNIAPPDQLVITQEEHAARVKLLFDAKFPPGTKFGAPLPPAPVVAAPPAKPEGLLRRVWDVVTLKRLHAQANKPAEPAKSAVVAVNTGVPAGPTLEEMTGRLAETMTVGPDDLRALAAARAQRVRDYFLHEGKISADRLFLTQGQGSKADQGPRVLLSLQ
ncbi:MAG: DUF748 domain-containing protein [Opitutales bacterium]